MQLMRLRQKSRCPAAILMLVAAPAILCSSRPSVLAQSPSSAYEASPGNEIAAENCMVKYIRNVNIPAEVEGKLIELKVEEGMRVSQGDVLAVIDDTSSKLALNLKLAEEKEASINAASDVNLRDALNSEKLALAEAESYRDLHSRGAVPMYEMRKKQLEAKRATLRIELADNEIDIKKAQFLAKKNERMIAEYEVDRRRIVAPFDGYVEMRIAQEGEWVQPGTPIITLVQLDKLRVEGDIDQFRYPGLVKTGMPVRVRVFREEDTANAIERKGVIGFVSSGLDLHNRYRVWVDIDNEPNSDGKAIKPGMKAEILVQVDQSAS